MGCRACIGRALFYTDGADNRFGEKERASSIVSDEGGAEDNEGRCREDGGRRGEEWESRLTEDAGFLCLASAVRSDRTIARAGHERQQYGKGRFIGLRMVGPWEDTAEPCTSS
jgi:hypothetical protein